METVLSCPNKWFTSKDGFLLWPLIGVCTVSEQLEVVALTERGVGSTSRHWAMCWGLACRGVKAQSTWDIQGLISEIKFYAYRTMCLRETSSLNRMTFYSFMHNLINKWSWSLQPFRRRRCNLLCFCDVFWDGLCSYLKHSANYKNSTEAGEMAHWLRELTALAEDQVWFPGPMSGSACPLAFSGTCSHMTHIHSLADMHTHK